jgi:cytidylate kinase
VCHTVAVNDVSVTFAAGTDHTGTQAALNEARARWEPLYEATQIKGDGETHPFLSPNDEFADYETWDKGNLDLSVPKEPEMLEFEYARSALRNGLLLEQQLGVNPYKFGLVGSTDAHTGLTAVEEENFFGKTSSTEPSPERGAHPFIARGDLVIMDWEMTASGYAAVWATENTREALFDAMERRETYATTGPRMIVRFFGGWEFEPDDAHSRLPAQTGYTKGVPMGGDLRDAPEGASPTFLVAALKDPIGANLDRIQIVKGWLDADGATHETVHDVVWSDAATRQPGPDGRLPPVGNTVNVAEAFWLNTIGDPELITVWQDPDFDPDQHAFYYARVIEIPTPRWTAYDQELIDKTAADHHVSGRLIQEVVDGGQSSWLEEFFVGLSSREQEYPNEVKLYHRVCQTIRALAEQGRAVIVGRGGAYVTHDLPDGLHVRLVGPLKHRIARAAETLKIPRAEATLQVSELDRKRSAFYQQYWYWQGNIFAPETFTVTLNTAAMDEPQIIACLTSLILPSGSGASGR